MVTPCAPTPEVIHDIPELPHRSHSALRMGLTRLAHPALSRNLQGRSKSMNTPATSNANAFITLRQWADLAATATADSPPNLSLLLGALDGSKFFKAARLADETDAFSQPLVAFEIEPPEGFTANEPRMMHAVDVAATRVMELAGAQVFTVRPSGGNDRFEFHVSFGKRGGRTTLHRILWALAKGPRLVERKAANYHLYVPGNFVAQSGLDRAKVIKIIAEHDAALAALLRDLFEMADRWHADELDHVD